jgi:hypothetical protein
MYDFLLIPKIKSIAPLFPSPSLSVSHIVRSGRCAERSVVASDGEIVLPERMANWSAGLAHVIVVPVLALRLGQLRGRTIDTSSGLSKVTLTA